MARRSVAKYRNTKTVVDGITFDSKAEAMRYNELKLLERAGVISDLKLQIPFVLFPKQAGEREAKYIADFVYTENGSQVVEDCKGFKTPEYILKRKAMLYLHGIKLRETGK